jgi:hypothetical protein
MGFNMGPVEGCGKFSESALVLRRRSTQRNSQSLSNSVKFGIVSAWTLI